MFGGFFKNMVKTADEVLISGVKVSVSINSLWVCFYYQHNRPAAVFCHDVPDFFFIIIILFFLQEVDEFFEQEKTFLLDYSGKIKDATAKAEKMTRSHKSETISSK